MEVGGQRHAWSLYPRERAGTHCIGSWVGPVWTGEENIAPIVRLHKIYKITNYLYIGTLPHVSQINRHPQVDVNTKEYKINKSNLKLYIKW